MRVVGRCMRQSVWALFVYENETPPMRPRVNRIKREGLHVLRHFGQPFTITCIFFVIDAAKTRAATHSSLLKAAPHTGQRLSRVLSFAAQFVQPRMKASRTLRLFFPYMVEYRTAPPVKLPPQSGHFTASFCLLPLTFSIFLPFLNVKTKRNERRKSPIAERI